MPHSFLTSHIQSRFSKLFVLACWVSGCVAVSAFGEEPSVSQPLDEPIMIQERLVSDESEEVPPEPVPPTEYQGLDSFTPALVAEQILRLRDALGEAPLCGRTGFQPLPMANEADENRHALPEIDFEEQRQFGSEQGAPAPWQREEDRRMLGERLRGMASRPRLARPYFTPRHRTVFEDQYQEARVPHAPPAPQPYPAAAEAPLSYPTPIYDPVPYVHGPVPGSPGASPEETRINVFRQSARQLEESAHLLECQDQFERADQIRELAQELRQDARHLREQSATAAFRPVRPVVGTRRRQASGDTPRFPEIPENAGIPRY